MPKSCFVIDHSVDSQKPNKLSESKQNNFLTCTDIPFANCEAAATVNSMLLSKFAYEYGSTSRLTYRKKNWDQTS